MSMTPDQKRRAFKRQQFTAITTAQRHLFASVYGVPSVQPLPDGGYMTVPLEAFSNE